MSWVAVIHSPSARSTEPRRPMLMIYHASKIAGMVTDAGNITMLVDGYQPVVVHEAIQFDDIRDCIDWIRNEERKYAERPKIRPEPAKKLKPAVLKKLTRKAKR